MVWDQAGLILDSIGGRLKFMNGSAIFGKVEKSDLREQVTQLSLRNSIDLHCFHGSVLSCLHLEFVVHAERVLDT